MNAQKENNVQSHRDGVWNVALAVLCFGILGYGHFFSRNTTSDPTFLLGEYFIYALLIWSIFYAIFLRKRGARVCAVAFIAIYGSLFFSALIGVSQQKQEAVRALSSVQQEVARVGNESVDSGGLPTRIARSPSTTPQATGEFGEMERWLKEHMDRTVALRSDYSLELEAIGWNSLLDPSRIKNDTTLSESKIMIKRAKAIAGKYEEKTILLLKDARAQISALAISEGAKKRALSGFDKGIKKGVANEQWELEKQVLLQFENIFLLLAASKTWVVEGGQILFVSDDELARFNSYLTKIQQIADQQMQIQKNTFSEIDQTLETAKAMAAR